MATSILIADDEPDIREVLELTLQDGEWTLLFATSADEVLAMAQEQKPTILLLDVVMPGRSGWDICEALKRDPATSQIYVVMLSCLSNPAHKRKAFQSGADAYITKPFRPSELRRDMETILRETGRRPAP